MSTDWSDDIVVVDLADEPALSDELGAVEERLCARAREGRVPSVVLDFSQVTYINSSNIAQLLSLRKTVADGGGLLRLAAVGGEVWTVMRTTGLDRVLRFSPDTMTALASVQIGGGEGPGGGGAQPEGP